MNTLFNHRLSYFFYITITEKVIKKIIIFYLYLIGIRKGKKMLTISYDSIIRGNTLEGCHQRIILREVSISSFDIGWVNSKKMQFEICLIAVDNVQKSYSSGWYKISQVRAFVKAQKLLEWQFGKYRQYIPYREKEIARPSQHRTFA